jgi:hypothetical protein
MEIPTAIKAPSIEPKEEAAPSPQRDDSDAHQADTEESAAEASAVPPAAPDASAAETDLVEEKPSPAEEPEPAKPKRGEQSE